jgi:cell division topological specificity factor
MSVIAFLDRLFGRTESSRDTAKSRLKLVLMHDRAAIPATMLEQMRAEVMAVLSKYVEIDQSALEMNLERSEGSIALLASIPILRVRSAGEIEERVPEPALS